MAYTDIYVTYRLKNSEFCKYVYGKMQENNLECCPGKVYKSKVKFEEYGLKARINCNRTISSWDNMEDCDFGNKFNGSICSVEKFLKEDDDKKQFRKILIEELQLEERLFRSEEYETHCIDEKFLDFLASDWSDDEYTARSMRDNEHFHMCSRLYELLKDAPCSDRIKKKDGIIHIVFNHDLDAPVKCGADQYIDLREWKLEATKYNFEMLDINTEVMSANFLLVIANFLPLEAIGEEEELRELFEQDVRNGNFYCDIRGQIPQEQEEMLRQVGELLQRREELLQEWEEMLRKRGELLRTWEEMFGYF